MCSHMITTWFQGIKIEFNLHRSGEIIFILASFKKKSKQTKTIVRYMISLVCLLNRVARVYHSAFGHGTCTARAYLTACAACLLFFLACYATNLFCADCVTWALLQHMFLCSLSVHKSAVDLTVLHWDPELSYCLFFRMSKLHSIEQCRQKSDKRRYTTPLRQHSWACMVSFPRRRGVENAYFVHPSAQMRDKRYGMVKWQTPRKTRG